MADEVAASAGKAVGKATVKAFMSPSFNIIKVIPQGIVELLLRGTAVVSKVNYIVGKFSVYSYVSI